MKIKANFNVKECVKKSKTKTVQLLLKKQKKKINNEIKTSTG